MLEYDFVEKEKLIMNNINTNKLTVTLLSLEQIYGDKRLKIFDKFILIIKLVIL